MFNSCSFAVHCNEKDTNVLLNFKQRLTDPSQLLSSWFPKSDCCEWRGVKCDNITGRVSMLTLPCHTHPSPITAVGEKGNKSHCLSGELNLGLLQLEYLTYLDLSNNGFKFLQFNSMGSRENSSNLQYLDLSRNYDILVRDLHWISNISSLQYLNLDGVHIHKEIDWLQSLTLLPSLSLLHLGFCQLEKIYPTLQYANFTSLKALNLADNDFVSELPSWLFNLSSDISYIDLSWNQIHGELPETMPNLRSIKFLYFTHNYLKGPLPNWLGQLEQLQTLRFSFNFFSGPIPACLGNLSSLIELNLDSNQLNGNLPKDLRKLFNLESLRVAENSLTGIVSERNLVSFSKLEVLSLNSPALVFDFDPEWTPPFQLQAVEFGHVRDKLPEWLFTQSSLKFLTIVDSTASFEPLDRFWNFSKQLHYFKLINNTVNGDISNVLLMPQFVWLVSNNLRGNMPRLSPEVIVLILHDNSLSGSISPLLCNKMSNKSNLIHLDMGYNHLSGDLTDCWNDWKSLVYVDLGYNNLTGKIPHSITSLSNLRFLYLESNKLFGEVPVSLKNCQNLWILDLGHNNFSGDIPNWLVQSVKGLKLRSNRFSGNIPTQLCQLHSLMVMDFASNGLSGAIPNCLHNITTMLSSDASTRAVGYTLNLPSFSTSVACTITMLIKGNELEYFNLMNLIDLSNNNLSGRVPLEMYMLTGLQSLNLSHNMLSGKIPKEIGNLEPLESIDLSRNFFSGEIPQTMSSLHYLEVLNLSFNNFKGKIPLGTQLGSSNLSYIGNSGLCGPPLSKICPEDEKSQNTKSTGEEEGDESEVHSMLYMGLGIGFAVGFWGVVGTIFFNRRCRHAYFRFVHQTYDFAIQKMNFI
ncbi:LRR receptor-like serine/threonine-protein kinase FLS2 [Vigna unguiculata]|uniref:LRR receptor-like serine/threonine-protein kinase FLS2 n=2 Tax=Vigna unguiculata TaxID=3917 RepID=A0A4D6MXQ1_VIGUN|nr:LRR receptor-like serine/threonine-protein kinase FLS2 [Vigna unguiculata]